MILKAWVLSINRNDGGDFDQTTCISDIWETHGHRGKNVRTTLQHELELNVQWYADVKMPEDIAFLKVV